MYFHKLNHTFSTCAESLFIESKTGSVGRYANVDNKNKKNTKLLFFLSTSGQYPSLKIID